MARHSSTTEVIAASFKGIDKKEVRALMDTGSTEFHMPVPGSEISHSYSISD